jgi:hypothetical protein
VRALAVRDTVAQCDERVNTLRHALCDAVDDERVDIRRVASRVRRVVRHAQVRGRCVRACVACMCTVRLDTCRACARSSTRALRQRVSAAFESWLFSELELSHTTSPSTASVSLSSPTPTTSPMFWRAASIDDLARDRDCARVCTELSALVAVTTPSRTPRIDRVSVLLSEMRDGDRVSLDTLLRCCNVGDVDDVRRVIAHVVGNLAQNTDAQARAIALRQSYIAHAQQLLSDAGVMHGDGDNDDDNTADVADDDDDDDIEHRQLRALHNSTSLRALVRDIACSDVSAAAHSANADVLRVRVCAVSVCACV